MASRAASVGALEVAQNRLPSGRKEVVEVAFCENGRCDLISDWRNERSKPTTALPLPSAKLPPMTAEKLYSSASQNSVLLEY